MTNDRSMLSDSIILKHIARQPKRSAGFKQLVRELGVRGDGRGELNFLLQKLTSSGQLILVDSDRYALPAAAAEKNLVAGRLTMHRDGFGFVIPDASALSPQMKARITGDIFVPPHLIGNSMHGDRVLVDISNVRPDGRGEGRIVRSVQRAHSTVVGIFHYGSRHNYVKAVDSKITQEIIIPPGMEIPAPSKPDDRNSSVPPVPSVFDSEVDSKPQTQRTQGAQRKIKS